MISLFWIVLQSLLSSFLIDRFYRRVFYFASRNSCSQFVARYGFKTRYGLVLSIFIVTVHLLFLASTAILTRNSISFFSTFSSFLFIDEILQFFNISSSIGFFCNQRHGVYKKSFFCFVYSHCHRNMTPSVDLSFYSLIMFINLSVSLPSVSSGSINFFQTCCLGCSNLKAFTKCSIFQLWHVSFGVGQVCFRFHFGALQSLHFDFFGLFPFFICFFPVNFNSCIGTFVVCFSYWYRNFPYSIFFSFPIVYVLFYFLLSSIRLGTFLSSVYLVILCCYLMF